jgi:curved DNA-binding protein CbpA
MTMIGVNFSGAGAGGDVETLYDALGVPETASADEIKQAYYRLVRQFRPTEYPDAFARFSEASRILTDNRRRGEYDQNRRSGRRVQVLLDQAAASLDKDSQKAINLLKNAIALAPDMPRPRHLLAHVLMKAEDYTTAEKQYRWLIKESPRDETLRYRLARCLQLQNRLSEAERELLHALKLNPAYFDALMLIARIYETTGHSQPAIDLLERAIANDGRETFADFEAFQRLLLFYVAGKNEADTARTAERLLAVIPADEEKANRAARRLMQRAGEFYQRNEYAAATVFADTASRISAAEAELREEAAAFVHHIAVTREATAACADPLFEGALREFVHIKYLDRASEAMRREKIENVFQTFQREIQGDPRTLAGAVDYLRREYPHVAADQNAVLQELAVRAAKRLELLGPSANSQIIKRTSPAVMPGAAEPVEAEQNKEAGRKGLLGWFRGGR